MDDCDFSIDQNKSPEIGDKVDVLCDDESIIYHMFIHAGSDDGIMTINYDK